MITGNNETAELVVEDSEFGRTPQVVGGLFHQLYAGRINRVSIRGSRFHSGFEGHLIKSRARQTMIAYNLIYDGEDGQSSYEVDLPAGGDAVLIGNIIGQGRGTQNPVVVSYGVEGRTWPRNRLLLSHNTLISDAPFAWYLRAWIDKLVPGATRARGQQPDRRAGRVHAGQQRTLRRQLARPAQHAGRPGHAGLRAEARHLPARARRPAARSGR